MSSSEPPIRPTLDERRDSRRLAMQAPGSAFGWAGTRNSLLFAILVLEYAGIGWCGAAGLPAVEDAYRKEAAQAGETVAPGVAWIFDGGRFLADAWYVLAAVGAALALLEALAIATRRWGLFDGLYFGLIVAGALVFLYAYVRLLAPLGR